MKILYITDLHGDIYKYNQSLKIAKKASVSMVINGGDMLPKSGSLFGQGKFITGFLADHFALFEKQGIFYLSFLGNDDLRIFDEFFNEVCGKFSYVENIAQRKVNIGGYSFIGMNWVCDYPFLLKDRCRMDSREYEFPEQLGKAKLSTPRGYRTVDDWFEYAKSLPTIEEELEGLPKADDMSKAIYVIHMPPLGLGLDVCFGGRKVGSRSVYDFIKRYQPRLSLHGHIHESPKVSGKWKGKIGETLCMQPGQLGGLSYAIIDLESMEAKLNEC
jgi:Icc-related predicted phosphoesterase